MVDINSDIIRKAQASFARRMDWITPNEYWKHRSQVDSVLTYRKKEGQFTLVADAEATFLLYGKVSTHE